MAATCSVCLGTSLESDKTWVALSDCGHTFHADCLDQAHAFSDKCPICRALIPRTVTARDGAALARNYPVRVRLDNLGAPSDGDTQAAASPGKEARDHELIWARAQYNQLQDEKEMLQQALAESRCGNSELSQHQKTAERALQEARQEARRMKQRLQQEVNAERSERQQLAVRLEKQQATLDRHELRTNPDLGRADVYRIAERHRKAGGGSPDVFADAMQQRNEQYRDLLNSTQRAAQKAEEREQTLQQRCYAAAAEAERVKRQLQAEQEARQMAERRAAEAHPPAQREPLSVLLAPLSSAGAGPLSRVPHGHRDSVSKGGALRLQQPAQQPSSSAPGGRQETEEDDQGFIELEEEDAAEAGADVTRPAPGGAAAPGGPRPQSLAGSSGLSFQRSSLGVGGAAAAGPRLAEPSFVGMPFRGVGTSSGTFIRQGPDGRGGEVKVLNFGSSRPAVGIQPKRMAGNRVPVPIKRRKGASNRGGNAITIQHFFDPQD